ncbi:glycosyltransferase family 39 protein [Candidatus Roizmanbacteria bacterium]|nr:glycosyltransferase family 39 protein [Candidatus Roizmanbacteria bacterium]
MFIFVITIFGAILRSSNISFHRLYPDYYQNLIVAHNISEFHSVIGYLGKEGMLYPDFFMWTRPIYPLIINFFNFFISNIDKAAFMTSFTLGIVSIPLVYFFLKKLFNNIGIAFSGALLIAISFSHVVWGGFMLTETTGVFFSLLLFISVLKGLENKPLLANSNDLITGLLLALAVFTRYEYITFIVPMIYLYLTKNEKLYVRVINIAVSFLFVAALIIYELFPLKWITKIFLSQTDTFAKIDIFSKPLNFQGVWTFFRLDFFLGIAFVFGIIYLFRVRVYRKYLFFALLGIFSLLPFYYRINPMMYRYETHLLPFILIPSSVGLYQLLKVREKLGLFIKMILFLLFIFQCFITWNGMKSWNQGEWMRSGYDESAARIVSSKIDQSKDLLLVSFPEPYYFYSRASVYSVIDKPPFIYIQKELEDRRIVIVVDMGMHDLFPRFTAQVRSRLKKYKKTEFKIDKTYHFGDYSIKEKYPVEMYILTVGQLKSSLK